MLISKISKIAVKATLIAILLVCIPFLHLMAQPDPGHDPSGAPIDGGISVLVAAGIGYGAKKVRDARKKTGEQNTGITEK